MLDADLLHARKGGSNSAVITAAGQGHSVAFASAADSAGNGTGSCVCFFASVDLRGNTESLESDQGCTLAPRRAQVPGRCGGGCAGGGAGDREKRRRRGPAAPAAVVTWRFCSVFQTALWLTTQALTELQQSCSGCRLMFAVCVRSYVGHITITRQCCMRMQHRAQQQQPFCKLNKWVQLQMNWYQSAMYDATRVCPTQLQHSMWSTAAALLLLSNDDMRGVMHLATAVTHVAIPPHTGQHRWTPGCQCNY